MKKRLLYIFSLLIILPCAILFSACSGKTETKLNVALANTTYTLNNNALCFSYGTRVDIKASDFIVTVSYENNTSSVLDYNKNSNEGFTMESNVPKTHPIALGEYQITFKYKDFSHSLKVKIEKEKVNIPSLNITAKDFTYDGTQKTALLDGDWTKIEQITTDTTRTYAGKYQIECKLKNPDINMWPDGTTDNKFVNWEIKKAKVYIPSLTSDIEVVDGIALFEFKHTPYNDGYTGVMQELTFEYYDKSILDVINHQATYPDTNGTPYEATFILLDEDNYEFADNKSSYQYKILPKKLKKPTLVNSRYDYVGSMQRPEYKDFDSIIMSYEGTAQNASPNPYQAKFTLLNKDDYVWEDGTTSDITYNWYIDKIDFDLTLPNDFKLETEYVLNGEVSSVDIKENLTALSKQFVETNNLTGEFTWKNPTDKLGAVGNKTFEIIYSHDEVNYNVNNLTLNVEIKKTVVDLSSASWSYTGPFSYTETPHTVTLNNCDVRVKPIYQNNTYTNAGSYTASVTFDYDEESYDLINLPNSLDWIINKADLNIEILTFNDKEVYYTGQYQQLLIEETLPDGVTAIYMYYDSEDNLITGLPKEVGRYKVVASFSVEVSSNYNAITSSLQAYLTIID